MSEFWRERLWPGKALATFSRVLLRCEPSLLTPGFMHRKIELKSCWGNDELKKIGLDFPSCQAHNASFFLLIMEEAKTATSSESGTHPNNSWVRTEIVEIADELEKGRAIGRGLGTLWTVTMKLHLQSHLRSAESSFNGGDLIVLHSEKTPRCILGIIQPWDPDYGSSEFRGEGDTTDFVRVLICVDQAADQRPNVGLGGNDSGSSSSSSRKERGGGTCYGGWAPAGAVHEGAHFSALVLGNVMTSIRECQALMSVSMLSAPLQRVILKAENEVTARRPSPLCLCNRDSKDSCGINEPFSPDAPVPVPQTTNQATSSSPSNIVSCRPSLIRPHNVPARLWEALSLRHNQSQLRAIRAVCVGEEAAGIDAAFTLLQGPPGTGKTATILGIIAVLLAGAGAEAAKGGVKNKPVKIVPGASLRGYEPAAARSMTVASSSRNFETRAKRRILVCAPSNTAVDELVYRMSKQGVLDVEGCRRKDLKIVRVGHPGGGSWRSVTTAKTTARGSEMAEVAQDGEADECSEIFDANTDSQVLNISTISGARSEVVECAAQLSLEYLMEERRQGGSTLRPDVLRMHIVEEADVVCSTLSGAGSQPVLEAALQLSGFQFDAVIIDEAAQAVEPSTLIPFKYNPKAVILVGDPCQLPATVVSRNANLNNYGQSLFQRLSVAGYPVLMLDVQYRMHNLIAEYPSQRFYHGKLSTDASVQCGPPVRPPPYRPMTSSLPSTYSIPDAVAINALSHCKPYHYDASGHYRPFVFHDVHGRSPDSTNYTNIAEVDYVLQLYTSFLHKYKHCISSSSVGIVSPYHKQKELLVKAFRERARQLPQGDSNYCRGKMVVAADYSDVEISTIDGFQGREKDIIIFSCVRGASSGSIGFLRDWQRLNVSLTRAKFGCWIIGNVQGLRRDEEFSKLIFFMEKRRYIIYSQDRTKQGTGFSKSIKQISNIKTSRRRNDAGRWHNTDGSKRDKGQQNMSAVSKRVLEEPQRPPHRTSSAASELSSGPARDMHCKRPHLEGDSDSVDRSVKARVYPANAEIIEIVD